MEQDTPAPFFAPSGRSQYNAPPTKVTVHEQEHRILAWARDESAAILEAAVEMYEQDFTRNKVSVARATPQLEAMLRGTENVADMPGAPMQEPLSEQHHLYVVEFTLSKMGEFTYPVSQAVASTQEN